MGGPFPIAEQLNYDTFRDCLIEPVLKALAAPTGKPTRKKKRHGKQGLKKGRKGCVESSAAPAESNIILEEQDTQPTDAEQLGDFIQYLSSTLFPSLPADLRTLTYPLFKQSSRLQDAYSTPLSSATYTSLLNTVTPTAIDSLEGSALLPPSSDATDQRNFLLPVFTSYITSVTAPPPLWSTTRASACELCQRDWVPLTYHHLIPKSTHLRVRKRGWHTEDKLNSVAWLCRACHSFVHRLAGNEELARDYYTLELIMEGGTDRDVGKRESVEGWIRWVGGVRWRSR